MELSAELDSRTIVEKYNLESRILVLTPRGGGGGDLEDFYPDVCVKGVERGPF